MPTFTLVPDEGMRIQLDPDEAHLLRELLKEMKTLLDADIPRADPVIARLFPDAYEATDDSESFREMVGDDLRSGKVEALRMVTDRVGRKGPLYSSIPNDEVDAWLTLLTDLRLAIGTRLDVTEEMMGAEPEADDPDGPAIQVLHWLGWMQESMLAALRGERLENTDEEA